MSCPAFGILDFTQGFDIYSFFLLSLVVPSLKCGNFYNSLLATGSRAQFSPPLVLLSSLLLENGELYVSVWD